MSCCAVLSKGQKTGEHESPLSYVLLLLFMLDGAIFYERRYTPFLFLFIFSFSFISSSLTDMASCFLVGIGYPLGSSVVQEDEDENYYVVKRVYWF
jgi:uncharacterized membrane-anchored protein